MDKIMDAIGLCRNMMPSLGHLQQRQSLRWMAYLFCQL
jgi:hypothetical protein